MFINVLTYTLYKRSDSCHSIMVLSFCLKSRHPTKNKRISTTQLIYKRYINGQLINIREVTDFHGGFLTIFSAVRWTTQLMNI